MADPVRPDHLADSLPVDIETAIRLIESGEAPDSISVAIDDGLIARADGRLGLTGLLQRLRGLRLLQALAELPAEERATPMRPFKPDLHPQVANILDALRKTD